MKKRFFSVTLQALLVGFVVFFSMATPISANPQNLRELPAGTVLVTPESVKTFFGDDYKLDDDIYFGHAAIVSNDRKQVIEVVGDGTIVKTPLKTWITNHKFWMAYQVKGATPEQNQKAASYAEKQVGNKPYPELDQLLDSKYDTNQFYCSSLVWRAWKEAGFDIDYDDGRNRTTGKLVETLTRVRNGDYDEKPIDTVFPAEIAQDPGLTPIAKSQSFHDGELKIKDEDAFYHNFALLRLNGDAPIMTDPLNNYKTKIVQEDGNKFELNFHENQSKAPVYISITDTSFFEKQIYSKRLAPGQKLEKVIIGSPAGEFQVKLTCTVIDQCKINGTIQSIKNWKNK